MASQRSRVTRNLVGFERMEDRKLMAVTAIIESNNKLVINADAAGGTVDVSTVRDQIQVVGSGATRSFPAHRVWSIVFNGSNSADTFTNRTSKASFVYGNAGDDFLVGGSSGDYIHGGIGNDNLDAGDSSFSPNQLHGGSGNDSLVSRNISDLLFGETGDDRLFGGLIHDGGPGNDALVAIHKATSMKGGIGADRFLRVDNHGKPSDLTSNDVSINFSNSDLAWTQKEIEQADEVFKQLQEEARNSTWILKDTLTGDPLKFTKVKLGSLGSPTKFGRNSISWSFFDFDRNIQIADWDENLLSDVLARKSTIIHEIGHNWDGTSWPLAYETNPLWLAFKVLHSQSIKSMISHEITAERMQEKIGARFWQMKFGKPGPENRSNILKAKLAIVDAFFAR